MGTAPGWEERLYTLERGGASCSEDGLGSVTRVIGTDDAGDASLTCMDGTMVISSGVSAASDDSRSTDRGGGGGLLSGGGLGLPNWSSRSLWIRRQWSANRVRSWKTSPQCLHL